MAHVKSVHQAEERAAREALKSKRVKAFEKDLPVSK